MPELIAGLIDVFADEPLTGNPLALVQAADELSEEQMRLLAGEFNQADTTFIVESARLLKSMVACEVLKFFSHPILGQAIA